MPKPNNNIEKKAKADNETELGGKISLVGFKALEPAELVIIKKIVGNYVKKMNENAGYESLKLNLQQHAKGKTFLHEINAQAIFKEGKFGSRVTDWNLYKALSNVLEKVLKEVIHKRKKH